MVVIVRCIVYTFKTYMSDVCVTVNQKPFCHQCSVRSHIFLFPYFLFCHY